MKPHIAVAQCKAVWDFEIIIDWLYCAGLIKLGYILDKPLGIYSVGGNTHRSTLHQHEKYFLYM